MYDNESEGGPKGTFEIYKAEADTLLKQGDYRKAIESYTIALELMPNDKNCLVARSRCQLALGDTSKALTDAETSLADDSTYHKGIYQKAEAMYQKGDFELALVFYHRGHKLRPELQEFRLGIQKAQEAIENCVGTPDRVQLNTTGDLSFFTEQDEKKKKRRPGAVVRPPTQQKQKQKRDLNRSHANEKTIKQMLGELYGDKRYLEKLLKETDSSTKTGKTIYDLADEGLSYLDTRTDFWRQQKPMYARRFERNAMRKKYSSKKPISDDYIIGELEKIDDAQSASKFKESLKRAQICLQTVDSYSEAQLANKMALKAQLHSCMGNAYLELGQYDKALQHHQEDYDIGEKFDIEEAVSRGLDNLGRVYARKGDFEKAIKVWDTKLPLSKTPLETTWLCHEIGRCHLEMDRPEKARDYGERSLAAAELADDQVWQLHASVLIAQSEVKLDELTSAFSNFEKALDMAKVLKDPSAEAAIKKAMEEVNEKIVQDVKSKDENNSATTSARNDDKGDGGKDEEAASDTETQQDQDTGAETEQTAADTEDKGNSSMNIPSLNWKMPDIVILLNSWHSL
ncbi:outer dynein arm-docking complex subunit 4-like [Babylonia areolata]|uniref:outer dynein arm-docking complex subunit 4-like n=1 Tax=Babylonia areolata TaxID=304850 RepID=UPI003FD2E57E